MEAYEAYHNSKDNALLLSQTQSEELVNKDTNGKNRKSDVASPKAIEQKKVSGEGENKEVDGE